MGLLQEMYEAAERLALLRPELPVCAKCGHLFFAGRRKPHTHCRNCDPLFYRGGQHGCGEQTELPLTYDPKD